ncbi:ABC transporter substrate-binding protein [Aggregatimonas sangjinii]|uniref:Thiamine pyrimidine synthase n=1 Tax=Aggregatimonas sangjinii TaxID=2583587 RepID=A0A5B7STV6_9FLAO|nr:ABC transporter substrate-binding protein [Aggregatimonas sangjinii]QCX02205.1 ABC transporter substrate-binding protein [Aggregatimonas sangjinii]
MENLKIALDWTANTNHTGFFVAKDKGYYENLGIKVEIMTPDTDDYSSTPAKKVELGQADMALCPFESVVSYRTKASPFDAIALATLFREDISAIATLDEGGIQSPKDLDGKTYASYQARYEDEIVRQMIRNDGGNGNFEIVYPKKLGIWETIVHKKYDATWIFTNWEGVQAKNEGIELKLFKMADYGIPYGYSPILLASETMVRKNKETYKKFLEATKKGFLFAQKHPEAAVACITSFVSEQDSNIDLLESQRFTSSFYGNAANWGHFDKDKVQTYINWLHESGLETQKLSVDALLFRGLI